MRTACTRGSTQPLEGRLGSLWCSQRGPVPPIPTQRERLEAHPLFERVSEEELEEDVAAGLLFEGTEEGQKVARNKGNTWRNVYRRIVPSSSAVAATAAEGEADTEAGGS